MVITGLSPTSKAPKFWSSPTLIVFLLFFIIATKTGVKRYLTVVSIWFPWQLVMLSHYRPSLLFVFYGEMSSYLCSLDIDGI